MSGLKYSIVVPLFNEQESVTPLYVKIIDVMDTPGEPYEIVFVDDGSRDAANTPPTHSTSSSPKTAAGRRRTVSKKLTAGSVRACCPAGPPAPAR